MTVALGTQAGGVAVGRDKPAAVNLYLRFANEAEPTVNQNSRAIRVMPHRLAAAAT